jgi:membrane protein implicated in regulation of membrane protease activity
LSAASPHTDYFQTILALPLFKWDAQTTTEVFSTRLWVYFVIAIPLTFFTMAFMYLWVRRREHRDREIAKKARMGGQFEGSETNAELQNPFIIDEEHGI